MPQLEMKLKDLWPLAKLVSEACSIQSVATFALETEPWDFAAVYWDTIDHFCHKYMHFYPPQMQNISDDQYNLNKDVVKGAYKLQDMMLSHLLKIAGEECTVILISDHGFHSDHLRPRYIPNEPAGPAYQHRDVGIFCAKGPNIKKDEIIYGASLLDITPTILTLMGFPVGEDMDGRPLVEIINAETNPSFIPSWEKVEGECGMLSEEIRNDDPVAAQNAIKQLVELGYIDDPGEDTTKAVEATVDELNYNLARVYFGSNRKELAIPILEKLVEAYPYRGRFVLRLISCYKELNQIPKAEELIRKFKIEVQKKILNEDRAQTIKERKPPVILNQKEKKKWYLENVITPIRESKQAENDLIQVLVYEGDILLSQGKNRKALKKYQEIEKNALKGKSFFIQFGLAHARLNKWKDSLKMFETALEFDPESHLAHLGKGVSLFELKNHEDAAEHLLTSVSLNFYQPIAHFYLAKTLIELKEYERAAEALEVTLTIAADFGKARSLLIHLYQSKLHNIEKAQRHQNAFNLGSIAETNDTAGSSNNEFTLFNFDHFSIKPLRNISANEQPILVVSGLPRSGTSVMMQMLESGGVPIFTDGERVADENNPKGYYEHEAVKKIHIENKWLHEAKGKVVKIVAPLVYTIPSTHSYKVIFMLRDLNEIVDSQHKMLVRNGKIKESDFSAGIEVNYMNYLNRVHPWIEKNKNIALLFVRYDRLISDTESEIQRIVEFIGMELNTEKMVQCVDKNLYRTKRQVSS
jgi:tetratricopeptide (TPR) repeat protein